MRCVTTEGVAEMATTQEPTKLREVEAELAQEALSGRAVLNVNSTAAGGGVAEMLQTLLAYVRGAGVDARWLVIQGDPTSSR